MTPKLLKPLLFTGTFLLAAFSLHHPASATELSPGVILDINLKAQGSDLSNADLDTSGSDNLGLAAGEAKFGLTANFNENALFFWEGRGVAGAGHGGIESSDTGSVARRESFLEWRQSYLQFSNLTDHPLSLKIGRQKVREDYGLWWNQNFDAIKLTYDTTLFKGSLGGGQNLFSYRTGEGDFTENDKDLAYLLAEGSWQYYYDHFFEARLAYQDDHSDLAVGDPENPSNPDDRDGHLFWGGLRAAGKIAGFEKADKLSYRADLMGLSGNEDVATIGANTVTALTGQHVRGWAFDAATDIPLPEMSPVIHLGYAFGSGDGNGADNTDHAFRQTGLQGNFSRIGALSEGTNNYGTVLRPELSNIHVLSAGFTMPVLDASNAGILYRYYRLDDPAAALSSSAIYNTLDGVHRQLGQGVDFLFNMDILKERQMNATAVHDVNLRSSLGFFRSGNAYGAADGETAMRGLVELKVGF
jgi:alginate production protein